MSLWAPWSLRELVADLDSGATTGPAALERSRQRVATTEPGIEAWVRYDADVAIPSGGRLRGIPFGVKDIIDVAGAPTRLGSARHHGAPPSERDAPVVSAWRATGAVPVGKTVTAEYAFFTPGPTRNPANPGHTPGSSSSGSAAAVAAGQVPLAIGTQTGGSATRPASYCGIASLTMAPGRFPFDGVFAMSRTLDSHGIFAATVSDLALAWAALTTTDDVGARPGRAPRLLWTGEPLGVLTRAMTAHVSAAAQDLRTAGATVHRFPLEELVAELVEAHAVVLRHELRTERAGELAVADQLGERWTRLRDECAATSPAGYESAQAAIRAGLAQVAAALDGYDAILGPAATGAAPEGLAVTGDPVMSLAWQALGLPAVGVPGGRDGAGLPLGLQVIARDESAALRAGVWVEQHLRC
jgi:Asp-tRNA(Asn)/Glu-tRNA(Gln) amidotransferase A subunit family amidase